MFMHTTYKHLGGILPSQKHSTERDLLLVKYSYFCIRFIEIL